MKHKTLTIIRIKHPKSQNRTLPVILFKTKPRQASISEATLKYFLMLSEQKLSNSLLNEYIHIIAKLYDYYHYKTQLEPHPKLFLDHLTKDLQNPKLSNWKPLKKQAYKHHLMVIKDFSRWLTKHLPLLKDPHEIKFATHIKTSYQFLEKNYLSKLFEPKTNNHHFKQNSQTTILKSFPISHLFELLKKSSIRDQLLFSILAFGGRRPAEVLNLYTQDLNIVNNELKVKICHPALSTIQNQTRKEYLLSHFNLEPRNEISNKYYTGFKGLKYEHQKSLSSETYFIMNMERYLVPLHNQYMKLRKKYRHHPYYFINLKNGDPLTLQSIKSRFQKLCRSLCLNKKDGGINMLALRHFYGSYLSQVLKLDHIEIKRLLHQISPEASLNYFNDKKLVWDSMARTTL